MPEKTRTIVLVAEDSQFDQMVLKRAFAAGAVNVELRFVSDGEDLLAYLVRTRLGTENGNQTEIRPDVVLMDLHMPRLNGRETLREIRKDEDLRHMPVLMLTTSDNDKHVREFYSLGANSYLVKPNDFKSLVVLVEKLNEYWFGTARLPARL
jgi:two-component system response regulator